MSDLWGRYQTPIIEMYDEMVRFYAQFDLLPPAKVAVGRKLQEEIDEFIVAMALGTDEEIADEAGDVIAVLLGGLIACGLPRTAILGGMYRVMAKNGAKTLDTHKRENGTINKR
jgi:phosphoribosyl-ATP pyrophosphohydrolase